MRDVYQILRDKNVHERLAKTEIPYRVLGGVAAHAILNANTIHWEDRIIEISATTQLPTVRDNGTARDIDTLVVSADAEEAATMKEILTHLVGDALSVSIFGLRKRIKTKKSFIPNTDFVSHRTVDAARNFYIQLDTVETPLADNWYDPWEVRRSQDDSPLFTTISPVAIEAGYRMRSITGVRPKDKDKLEQLQARLNLDEGLTNTLSSGRPFTGTYVSACSGRSSCFSYRGKKKYAQTMVQD